jgi:hypothetical protein
MKKTLAIFISFFAFALVGLFGFADEAQAARFYLSPSTGSVQINNNITLDIRLDAEGVPTAIADLKLNYDPSKLEYVTNSYTNTGSPLITAVAFSAGSGTVTVTQFIPGSGTTPPTPVEGDFLYGKITFKALAGSGSTPVSFSTGPGNSVMYSFYDTDGKPVENPAGGDPQPTSGQGGTYSFTSPPVNPPPPPPPPPPSGTNPPPPPPSGTTGTKPPPPPVSSGTTTNSEGAETTNIPNSVSDTTGPTITDIKVTNVTENSVVIEWETNEASTSYVDLGLTTKYTFGTGDGSYTKEHKVTISSLESSTQYNFRVYSTDQAINTSYSKNQTFTTKPPVSVQRTYRFVGLAMIIGGLSALAVIAFYYFRKKGPHPDNLGDPQGPVANLNPPI